MLKLRYGWDAATVEALIDRPLSGNEAEYGVHNHTTGSRGAAKALQPAPTTHQPITEEAWQTIHQKTQMNWTAKKKNLGDGAEIARFVSNQNATAALMKVWERCGLNRSDEIPNIMIMAFEIMDYIDDLEEQLKKAKRG